MRIRALTKAKVKYANLLFLAATHFSRKQWNFLGLVLRKVRGRGCDWLQQQGEIALLKNVFMPWKTFIVFCEPLKWNILCMYSFICWADLHNSFQVYCVTTLTLIIVLTRTGQIRLGFCKISFLGFFSHSQVNFGSIQSSFRIKFSIVTKLRAVPFS